MIDDVALETQEPEQSDDCREVFEKWRISELQRDFRNTYNYEDSHTQLAWSAWQESWESRPVPQSGKQRCAATISSDPPMDCNWPFCGCDPAADNIMTTLQECGVLPEWQPVEKDQPPEKQRVLLLQDGGPLGRKVIAGWRFDWFYRDEHSPIAGVTHWMPMPALPNP